MTLDGFLELLGLAKHSYYQEAVGRANYHLEGQREAEALLQYTQHDLKDSEARLQDSEDLVKEIPNTLFQELCRRSGLINADSKPTVKDWGELSNKISSTRNELDAANLRAQYFTQYDRLVAEEVKLSQHLTLLLQTNPAYRFQIDSKGSATEAVIRLLDLMQYQLTEALKHQHQLEEGRKTT